MVSEMSKIEIDLPHSVSAVINFLKSDENVNRLILFGSRVHGDSLSKSDFDMAVDIKNQDHFEFLRIKDIVENELSSLFYVSLVDYNQSPKKLKNIINKTGKLIYESEKNK